MSQESNEGATGSPWAGRIQIAVIAVLLVVAVYFARAPSQAPASPVAEGAAIKPEVVVVRPMPGPQTPTLELTGGVGLERQVTLSAQTSGRVIGVSDALRAGGAFKAGEMLLAVDPQDAERALRIARHAADAAEARMRIHPAGTAKHDRFKARWEATKVGVESAQIALSRTTVSLPFAANVLSSGVSLGDMIGPAGSFGVAYTDDALQISAPVAPADIARFDLREGTAASVTAGPGRYAASVSRVSWTVDPRSRQATVFLRFAAPAPGEAPAADATLAPLPPPGAFALIEIPGPVRDDAYALPHAARQAGDAVWTVQDGKLESVVPETLDRTDAAWIVAAFHAGDGVVVGALQGGATGMAVDVVDVVDAP